MSQVLLHLYEKKQQIEEQLNNPLLTREKRKKLLHKLIQIQHQISLRKITTEVPLL